VFLSKLWFFVIAVVAGTAVAIALSMPRPAERATVATEAVRLRRACGVATILLTQNARDRVDLAANFARADAPAGSPRLKLDDILYNASNGQIVSDDAHKTAKSALNYLVDSVSGKKPNFVIAVNRQGLVAARSGIADTEYGDSLAGYHAIDDALDGYLRDDTWLLERKLYRVAASPVIEQREGAYAGAVVLGHEFDKELAERLAENIGAHVGFYANGEAVAASTPAQIHKDVLAAYASWRSSVDLANGDAATDCTQNAQLTIQAGDEAFNVVFARLPGEARMAGAFYAVFIPAPVGVGFGGTLSQITSDDMSFGTFPWLRLGVVFLVCVGAGLGLMYYEGDRPIRGLVRDAVALAQGEAQRLDEMAHKGKAGSIARSINIALDKLERDAKNAKRDLDSLLSPGPGQDSRSATAIPPVGPAGPPLEPFAPPPPSEFRFKDNVARPPARPSAPPARPPGVPDAARARPSASLPPAPPPFELDLPPPRPDLADVNSSIGPAVSARPSDEQVPPPPVSLPFEPSPSRPARSSAPATPRPRAESDFDAPTRVADPNVDLLQQAASDLGGFEPEAAVPAADNREFRKVFDEFSALKRQCGESTDALTYDKFAAKLQRNREALMAKHGCKSVKFQVYIKDGKAALKATPVKS
jgi:hypothetical protein